MVVFIIAPNVSDFANKHVEATSGLIKNNSVISCKFANQKLENHGRI
jgi:hypothetical protein